MLHIAGQKAGLIGLTFFVDTHGWSGVLKAKFEIQNFFPQFFYIFKKKISEGNSGHFS